MSRQPPIERLAWLVNRLRCMSLGEVGYRMQQAAVGRLERRAMPRWSAPAPESTARALPRAGTPPLQPGEADAILQDAQRIKAGEVVLFADQRFNVGPQPEWNRDPSSGVLGPSVFAGDIRITDRALVAVCPVSLQDRNARQASTQVSMFWTPLGAPVATLAQNGRTV